jgi:hypothetical protein
MLIRRENDERPARNLRKERRLWHDENHNSASIGCAACPEVRLCGGLRVASALFDCLNYCCGHPETCDRVCRNNPDFPARVREVSTLSLDNVPRTVASSIPTLPNIVPMLFHGDRRSQPLAYEAIALPLYSMFDRRDGSPKFASNDELCAAYTITPGTRVVLSGTAKDRPLERWWELGELGRRRIIRSLRTIQIALVTTPNYSMFTDQPRWGDLHALKRIAITHTELLEEGVPAALHVNGRTDMDFARWSEYIAKRPEVTHVAYEFTTGSGWPGRREQHARWLRELAAAAGRPLHLVLRGGAEVMASLAGVFTSVTVLNTEIFMKTMMRRKAASKADGRVRWDSIRTPAGAPLDQLLLDNLAVVTNTSRETTA